MDALEQEYADGWWHQLKNEQERREYESWLDEYDKENTEMDMTKFAGSESKYLKASDIGSARPTVTIAGVELLEFDDDEKGKHQKPALRFEGKEKKLVVNATNCEELIRAFGSDSDKWVGQQIVLSTKYYKAFDREGLVLSPVLKSNDLDDDIPW